jgi:hypothetical protein
MNAELWDQRLCINSTLLRNEITKSVLLSTSQGLLRIVIFSMLSVSLIYYLVESNSFKKVDNLCKKKENMYYSWHICRLLPVLLTLATLLCQIFNFAVILMFFTNYVKS